MSAVYASVKATTARREERRALRAARDAIPHEGEEPGPDLDWSCAESAASAIRHLEMSHIEWVLAVVALMQWVGEGEA